MQLAHILVLRSSAMQLAHMLVPTYIVKQGSSTKAQGRMLCCQFRVWEKNSSPLSTSHVYSKWDL